jgi:hypothetical protein
MNQKRLLVYFSRRCVRKRAGVHLSLSRRVYFFCSHTVAHTHVCVSSDKYKTYFRLLLQITVLETCNARGRSPGIASSCFLLSFCASCRRSGARAHSANFRCATVCVLFTFVCFQFHTHRLKKSQVAVNARV